MDGSIRAAIWIIAVGVIVAGLYWFREPLTQFALALILWLAIDGLAEAIDSRIKPLSRPFALLIAVVLVLSLVSVVVFVVATNFGSFAEKADTYVTRLDALAVDIHAVLGLDGAAPTLRGMIANADPAALIADIGRALQGFIGDAVFILIYLGFLFSAAEMTPKKLDAIFSDDAQREQTREVMASIRLSMERYLWVQTVASLIITALTFVTLRVIGLDNALFWAFLIFFLNYIPTIGSIIATVLPTAFALAQFPDLAPVAATALGVGAWQFIIGNFVQPRMTGETLNLAAVVVLLALAIWGLIWGIAGAFLAAPLTVMLMIILAQFRSTRWIAILMSADSKPALLSSAQRNSAKS